MRRKYKKEDIEEAIVKSKTWTDVCILLGIKPNTGAQTHLQKRAKEYGIEQPSHFLGKASNKGKKFKKKNVLEYCFNGSKISSHSLKLRLIRDGHKKALCELCGISEWMGEPVVLELDHKDSNHHNNELYNLQIICPNCHALETRKRRGIAGMVDNLVLETKAK